MGWIVSFRRTIYLREPRNWSRWNSNAYRCTAGNYADNIKKTVNSHECVNLRLIFYWRKVSLMCAQLNILYFQKWLYQSESWCCLLQWQFRNHRTFPWTIREKYLYQRNISLSLRYKAISKIGIRRELAPD